VAVRGDSQPFRASAARMPRRSGRYRLAAAVAASEALAGLKDWQGFGAASAVTKAVDDRMLWTQEPLFFRVAEQMAAERKRQRKLLGGR
jgi:hypothetical protein